MEARQCPGSRPWGQVRAMGRHQTNSSSSRTRDAEREGPQGSSRTQVSELFEDCSDAKRGIKEIEVWRLELRDWLLESGLEFLHIRKVVKDTWRSYLM